MGEKDKNKKYKDFNEFMKLNKIPEWYNMYFNYESFMNNMIKNGTNGNSSEG